VTNVLTKRQTDWSGVQFEIRAGTYSALAGACALGLGPLGGLSALGPLSGRVGLSPLAWPFSGAGPLSPPWPFGPLSGLPGRSPASGRRPRFSVLGSSFLASAVAAGAATGSGKGVLLSTRTLSVDFTSV
jgi:hypothetical protein